jgi:hypothetical protein
MYCTFLPTRELYPIIGLFLRLDPVDQNVQYRRTFSDLDLSYHMGTSTLQDGIILGYLI